MAGATNQTEKARRKANDEAQTSKGWLEDGGAGAVRPRRRPRTRPSQHPYAPS